MAKAPSTAARRPPPPQILNAPADSPLPQFVPPVAHAVVGVSVGGVQELLKHLRMVRDQKAYLAEAQSFREWSMKNFGERMGGWLDDNL